MDKDGSSSRLPLSPSEGNPPEERKEVRLLKQRKKRDDALSFLILSGLCFVLSLIFLLLSFRKNYLGTKTFTPASLEFVVCAISFLAFLILLGMGLYKFIRSSKEIKSLSQE